MRREREPNIYEVYSTKNAQEMLNDLWELIENQSINIKKTGVQKIKDLVAEVVRQKNIQDPQARLQYMVELVEALKNEEKILTGGVKEAPALAEDYDEDVFQDIGYTKR